MVSGGFWSNLVESVSPSERRVVEIGVWWFLVELSRISLLVRRRCVVEFGFLVVGIPEVARSLPAGGPCLGRGVPGRGGRGWVLRGGQLERVGLRRPDGREFRRLPPPQPTVPRLLPPLSLRTFPEHFIFISTMIPRLGVTSNKITHGQKRLCNSRTAEVCLCIVIRSPHKFGAIHSLLAT